MPYTKDNPPDRIKALPKHAQEIWISAFNNAIKQYKGDEEKANATAWAAVEKAGYKETKEGKWIKASEEAEPNFDEVPIFATGEYPQGKFTPKDLDEIVANYNPKKHEAPVTIDHAFDGPAHGWIEKIWRQGNKLYAKVKEVSAWLADQIKSGAYKKRSIEIWDNYEGTGRKMLKAVSFLGAMIPQVKGLKNIYAEYDGAHGRIAFFSEPIEYKVTEQDKDAQKARSAKFGISIIENGNVTKPSEWSDVPDDQWGDPVNFAYPCHDKAQTETALKYWDMPRNRQRYPDKDQAKINEYLKGFAKKFEIESKTFKDSEEEMELKEVQKMIDDALAKQKTELTATFSEEIKKLTEQNEKLQKDIAEKEKTFAEQQKSARVDGLIGGLLKDRKILPALKDAGLKQFMMGLDDSKIIEFGENKKSMTDWLAEVFGQKLPGIDFSEIAGPEKTKSGTVLAFSVMDEGLDKNAVDKDSFDLNEKATAYAEEHKVSFKDAVIAVSKL